MYINLLLPRDLALYSQSSALLVLNFIKDSQLVFEIQERAHQVYKDTTCLSADSPPSDTLFLT